MALHVFIFLLAACTSVAIILAALRRRTAPGAYSLVAFALALTVWAIPYALYWAGVYPIESFWLSATYLGATIAPVTLFTFTLDYNNLRNWLTRRNIALLAIEPLMTQVLIWTHTWHKLFIIGEKVEMTGTILTTGVWFWMNTIYSNGLVLIAIYLIIRAYVRMPHLYRQQTGTLLVGALTPIATSIISLAGLAPIPGLDLTPLAFSITGLAFTCALLRYRLLDLVPIGRDFVVESMSDGWMVLDTQNRIVDLNPAAEAVINLPRNKIFGQPAENVLNDWPNLMKSYGGNVRELDMKGSVRLRNEWRYLNVRIFPLKDKSGHYFGQLILWRDMTERRWAEDARQRARDEMFMLLNAISSAGSRALNLDDFLAESIYQIVYSFQSQISVVILLDESNNPKLTLAAHHGLSAESLDSMSSMLAANEVLAWVLKNQEPMLIPDISVDPRIPVPMQQIGRMSLLIVPMIIEGQTLGVMGLARKEGPVYSADEIARLTVVAEQVATSIQSHRRRQMAIALVERQRLVRDLHDSVTQKLCGLLTLTEAAQAGLEAGSNIMPVQVLSRIGENARQALKEMRLFLFELQPVDLEREGLVSILHQRLAAVEGRADIKASLLADDKVTLPPDKQEALYYIAQEALNNVLRHARAKSVTVRLKQKRSGVTLEITDDGFGFDPQNSDKGGMGLRNMRERASQIGARIKIISTPSEGTRVTVTVPKDESSNSIQKRSRR